MFTVMSRVRHPAVLLICLGFAFLSSSAASAKIKHHITFKNRSAVDANDAVYISTLVTATDNDNDALTYTVNDGNSDAGSAYLHLSGSILTAGQDHVLSQAQFNNLRIFGGNNSATDSITVQISDGSAS